MIFDLRVEGRSGDSNYRLFKDLDELRDPEIPKPKGRSKMTFCLLKNIQFIPIWKIFEVPVEKGRSGDSNYRFFLDLDEFRNTRNPKTERAFESEVFFFKKHQIWTNF